MPQCGEGPYLIREDPLSNDVIVVKAAYGGDSHSRVDVAILGEGYTAFEEDKFRADVARFTKLMLGYERYGGGGIYNLFCTFTSDNQWSEYVFLHEFGHHFAGLADEYYTSSTAYNDFYPRGIEPHERNITRLLDPDHVKWEDLVTRGTAIPTPWKKTYTMPRTSSTKRIAPR